MSKVTLPRLNQTGANEWSDVEANDVALREVINGGLDNENIAPGANIARSKLEASAQGVSGTWYSPKVVATEESTASATFTTLTTADEIPGVVLPANGQIRVGWSGLVKTSGIGTGRIALFLGSGAVSNYLGTTEYTLGLGGTQFGLIVTTPVVPPEGGGSGGVFMRGVETNGPLATTGVSIPAINIFAAAGTYSVAVKFRATAGTITAKERKLWVEVHGV